MIEKANTPDTETRDAVRRVTMDQIEAKIVAEQYLHPMGTTLTLALLTLQNGTIVVGQSATVSPALFNAELGKDIARKDAVSKIWALEGYLLKETIWREGLTP